MVAARINRAAAGRRGRLKAGVANGHHLLSRSDSDAVYLEIGTPPLRERAHFSDVDIVVADEAGVHYSRKAGGRL